MATLFSGGMVFDGERPLEDHGVLVEGDTITRVAPMAEFAGYAGDGVDTTGGTLMPGLIDCHVHLCMSGAPDPKADMEKKTAGQLTMTALLQARNSLRNGLTALRDCGGKDYLEFAVRDACNRGEIQGPTIRAAGKMICMTGGHGNQWGRVADGRDEVVKAVREQIHAGCDLVKIMATGGVLTPGVNPEDAHYTAEEMAAGIHEAKRFHKRTASHAQGTEGILNAVRGGIDSIEHGIFMSEKSIREMIDAGTWLVPTLAALQNILDNADKGIPPYAVEKTRRVSAVHRESIAAFYKAGGKLAMGTDAGTPFNLHGANARELALMVGVGVSSTDALHAGTASAAELLGIDDIGRIKEGFKADLLIVEGNPMQDINAAADPANHRAVYKNGDLVI